MGVDLRVFPNNWPRLTGPGCGPILTVDRLSFRRDRDLFQRLRELGRLLSENPKLPDTIEIYRDTGLKVTATDATGDLLLYVTPADLRKVDRLGRDLAPKNSAILHYLRSLSPETTIILYFH